ncbi:metal ABC transporter solute-binding protein, Zn/Mn family [Marinilactibacillus psychrotolerans]|uniref:metal ABC transporter solute-binding protein, Zn/Mn family n=1 Tax=Marinilactibacillus psychrotolerans TaxID=191770 RepID=UPI0037F4D021
MKYKWLRSAMLTLVAGTALTACSTGETEKNSAEEDKVSIVTSFYPMYEFASQVAGDRADITMMVGGGDDPHHYEPSAKDVATVNEADLFVYSSPEMEFWTESLFETVENDDLKIVSAAEGVDQSAHSEEDHDHTEGESAGEVKIASAAEHYHSGDMAELTAKVEGNTTLDHWHWYTRSDESADWEAVPNEFGSELSYLVLDENFEVKAELYGEDHEVLTESEPVTITVDNHEDEGEEAHDHESEEAHDHESEEAHDQEGEATETGEDVVVAGLAGHYHTGDAVTIVAETEIKVSEWQWSTRKSDETEWSVISDQTTEQFTGEAVSGGLEIQGVGLDAEGNEVVNTGTIEIIVDDHENEDPHSWLDPVLVQEQVDAIRDALIEVDPEGEEVYTANAANFNERLQALDQEFQEAFEGAEDRVFVVQHQAFGYIAERYDLEQIAVGGLSTEVEPSPSRIAEIGKLVEEYNVPVIYYQQGSDSSIAQTIASETGTETAVLHDLESLSEELQSENLGYIEAMEQNIEALKLSIK